jgi:hypothetical protein
MNPAIGLCDEQIGRSDNHEPDGQEFGHCDHSGGGNGAARAACAIQPGISEMNRLWRNMR